MRKKMLKFVPDSVLRYIHIKNYFYGITRWETVVR